MSCKQNASKNETADAACFKLIDKAVAKLQKFGLAMDTTQLDSALFYYDEAINCDRTNDTKSANKATTLGRYRESLTIIDNVFKVREVPTSKDLHFLMIKAWLYDKLGEKDSSAVYLERFQRITTPE